MNHQVSPPPSPTLRLEPRLLGPVYKSVPYPFSTSTEEVSFKPYKIKISALPTYLSTGDFIFKIPSLKTH